MPDQFASQYEELIAGVCDCVYLPGCGNGGGFRNWWRSLFGSDDEIDNEIPRGPL